MLAACLAVFGVCLLYVPALQAPFVVPKVAVLEITAALGFVAFALRRVAEGRPRWSPHVALGVLAVLLTTAFAWLAVARGPSGAPYAPAALARWASLFGLAAGASVLADDREARQRVFEAVTVAAAAVSAVGLWQHLDITPLPIPVISTPGSTFGNRNIAADTIAMALPFGLAALRGASHRGGRTVLMGALVLVLVYLAATRARGAWLGALAGGTTALALMRPRASRGAVAATVGLVLLAVVAAYVPGRFHPRHAGDWKRYENVLHIVAESFNTRSTAVRTRLGLWRRTVAMVREQPFFGVGPGNWPVVFPRYAEPGAARDGVLSATLEPRQAHNDLLERAGETGIIGLAAWLYLLVGVACSVRRRIRSRDAGAQTAAGAAGGALVALIALGITGFPLEMPGTLTLAGLALGLVATADTTVGSRAALVSALDRAALVSALVLSIAAVVRAERSVRGSAWLRTGERAMQVDRSTDGAVRALAALDRARAATPDSFRVHLRRSQSLLRLQRSREAARAAHEAIALEPYGPNGWAALSAAELSAGDPASARTTASRALRLLHDHPLALSVRAEAAEAQGDQEAAALDRGHLRRLAEGDEQDRSTRAVRSLLERVR
jgi:O-antigen ligase